MLTTDLVLARARASARLRSAWMERMWSEGRTSYDQGLAITPGEVRRILTEPGIEAERYRQFLEENEASQMSRAVEEADEALAWNGFWNWMGETFELDTSERDLLRLIVAVELDPRLSRVLAYLADDTRATSPSATMAAMLFENKQNAPRPAVTPMSALLRWRLAQPLSGEAGVAGQDGVASR